MAKKNHIDRNDALLELRSQDFEVEELEPWHWRITASDMAPIYDWYHTTGTLVRIYKGRIVRGTLIYKKELK